MSSNFRIRSDLIFSEGQKICVGEVLIKNVKISVPFHVKHFTQVFTICDINS